MKVTAWQHQPAEVLACPSRSCPAELVPPCITHAARVLHLSQSCSAISQMPLVILRLVFPFSLLPAYNMPPSNGHVSRYTGLGLQLIEILSANYFILSYGAVSGGRLA